MRSPGSEFKYRDRGYADTLVLVPGWASDAAVFSGVAFPFNYLLCTKALPGVFHRDLSREMDARGLKRVSLLGWSLGGFLALEFARQYPERVTGLELYGIRLRYPEDELAHSRKMLLRNKNAYLRSFFTSFFCEQEAEQFGWFKKNLMMKYLNDIPLSELLDGLDYLGQARVEPWANPGGIGVRITHGAQDLIAPEAEARAAGASITGAEFMSLSGRGHMPFLGAEGVNDMC